MYDATQAYYWHIIKGRAGLIMFAFLLVMVTAGVATYLLPRQYFSKVTVEVRPDNSIICYVDAAAERAAANDPTFISTQFQNLQKTEILYPVIDSLKLVDKWGYAGKRMTQQDAFVKLRRMMDLREVRNTGLIEIGVYNTNAQEAADIANTVAEVYRENRLGKIQENIDRGLGQLREEIEKQRTRAEEAASEMAKIRERDKIIDPDPESSTSILGIVDPNIVSLEPAFNEHRVGGKNKVGAYVNKAGAYANAKNQYLQAKKIFEAGQAKLSLESLERSSDFEPAKIWERAEPSLTPIKPNVPAYMTLAALAGISIGVGLAFFVEYLDKRVKNPR